MTEQIPLLDVDPAAPRELEFYETPRWQVEALLTRLPLRAMSRVVEPCAGNGAIVRALDEHVLYLWTNDLVEREYQLCSCGDATLRATWERFVLEFGEIDAVITNLPFTWALSILEHAVEFAPVVATLLRRTWDEPVIERDTEKDRGAWLQAHPCSGQIVLPRYSYRGEGTDGATTAWFIWDRDGHLKQPFDVVTKAERDELVARFGKR